MKEELRHKMEVEKDGRIYAFDIPYGSPYGEAYDVCHEILQKIVQLAQEATEKTKRQEAASDVHSEKACKDS